MIETYNAISNRFNFFFAELKKLKEGESQDDNEQYAHPIQVNTPIPSLEIDLFVKEFSATNKKHLEFFYDCYLDLLNRIELFGLSVPENSITHILAQHLWFDVRDLVEHLSDLLFPDPEISEQPQEVEELGAIEEISMETIKSKGLSLPEIVLICVYTDQAIDKSNAAQILNKFNPKWTSEQRLIELYNNYQFAGNRIYLTENKTKDKNKEKLLMSVFSYLETNGLDTTKLGEELKTLSESIIAKY